MTTIQIRIDEKTKNSAKKVLDAMGMDISSAVKIYLTQIIRTKGIPFRILTENGLTIEQEMEILKAEDEALRGINVTTTRNWKESQAHLDSLKRKPHDRKVPKKNR